MLFWNPLFVPFQHIFLHQKWMHISCYFFVLLKKTGEITANMKNVPSSAWTAWMFSLLQSIQYSWPFVFTRFNIENRNSMLNVRLILLLVRYENCVSFTWHYLNYLNYLWSSSYDAAGPFFRKWRNGPVPIRRQILFSTVARL